MNDLSFTQISTLLNSIYEQAVGRKGITPTNNGEFVSVAQTTLLSGYDNVINAISQVLSRTIFSIRPYYRKLAGMQVSQQRYGNHIRKLQALDIQLEDDQRQPLEDGTSVDMYTINKPKVVQTNFYGQSAYQAHITIFRDQLDVAFSSAEEFGRFISMIMTNIQNQIEQYHEGMARGALANLIGGTIAIGNQPQIVHLLSEYNAQSGSKLTATTLYQPDNYSAFTRWSYAKVASVASMLTERSDVYHQNLTDKPIPRHTPYAQQKTYLYAPNRYNIEAMVLADTYNINFLKMSENETLNYWQSIETPDSISVTATFMNKAGTLETATVDQSNIYGITFDEEAAGYTVVNQWSASTPFNAAGGYTNMYWHFTDKYWNDFTENAVVYLLD